MPVSVGDKFGPYEILAPIGKGGMGEVWRARDTRLNREVAIKFSQAQFSDRFQREANAIASLNHPNICTLFDVGPNYLVMEYVEGADLKGPAPIERALEIAGQIAGALDAAHEKGIVHRDLKPGNIKIRPDGSVKVLDFGLAKSATQPEVTSNSPTMLSVAGMILGTAGYMSPEQARGQEVDKRADIFAFGAVLYELLRGERLFEGPTVTDTLASVLTREPDYTRVPAKVRRLLAKCLEKDPKKRLRDIGDWAELLEIGNSPDALPQRIQWLWPLLAALFLFVAAALALVHFREKPQTAQSINFEVQPPSGTEIVESDISPDGRKLALNTRSKDGRLSLWVRRLDSTEMHELPGTTEATDPAWSPDSQHLAFMAGGSVKKIDISGGGPQTLTPYRQNSGTSWGSQDVIVFGNRGSDFTLSRVPGVGGDAADVTRIDTGIGETGNGHPFFLPDGKHFFYYRYTTKPETQGTYIGSIDPKPEAKSEVRLMGGTTRPVYATVPGSRDGYLFFARDAALMVQPFDLGRRELKGKAVQIVDHVGINYVVGNFSVSNTGAVSYSAAQGDQRQLTWYDRQGRVLGRVGEPARRDELSLSPDGTRVAEGRLEENITNWVVWQLDLTRGISSRLTFENSGAGDAIWSPDGKQIVYAPGGGQSQDIYLKAANGATQGELLFHSDGTKSPMDWSRDGRYLIFTQAGKDTGSDLWVVPMQGEHKPAPYLVTPFHEDQAKFSADGRWVVYTSDETRAKEVYVRPFPAANGGKWQISNGGGNEPRWRRDGKELFFVGPDNMLYSVSVTVKGDVFQPETPKPLFRVPISGGSGGGESLLWRWDVSNDGQRILVNAPVESQSAQPITVLLNWQNMLKQTAQTSP